MNRLRSRLCLEPLETRYAPATLVNPFTVTFSDEPGKKVVVKISKPVFDEATIDNVFTFNTGSVNGDNSEVQILQKVDLSILNAGGATLTIARPTIKDHISVGVIDATGLDLAAIVVDGGVETITVGDADLSTPGLGRLQIQVLFSATAPSVIQGDLTRVILSSDLHGFLDVNGAIQSFKAKTLRGESPEDSGHLRCSGSIGSVVLSGGLLGDGGAQRAGFIEAGGDIGKIVVADSIEGGEDDSGRIKSGGNIGKVTIGGSVKGDQGSKSGSIFASGDIGTVKTGGNLLGGSGVDSGSIFTQFGRIGSVTIGGSIVTGSGVRNGSIRAARDLGSVTVKGDLGGSAGDPVIISGFGQLTPGPDTDLAIGYVKIGGDVSDVRILAGFSTLGLPSNKDAQIGSVKVGGDWRSGSIVAGVDDGADNLFGTNDDTLFNEAGGGDPNIIARIGKITIKGTADGSAISNDGFGFVAEEIGSLSIDGVFIALTAGASNDTSALGTTGDFNLKEV